MNSQIKNADEFSHFNKLSKIVNVNLLRQFKRFLLNHRKKKRRTKNRTQTYLYFSYNVAKKIRLYHGLNQEEIRNNAELSIFKRIW